MKRYFELDFFRGLAVLMMILFHFLYDLNLFHFIKVALFTHPFWILYRQTLLFLFFGVSGFCLFLIHSQGIRWKSFAKWFVRIGGSALLVSIATYFYDPKKFVYFGVLHFIALSGLLSIPFLRYRRLSLLVGIGVLSLGFMGNLNDKSFYIPYLAWLGFGAMRPITYDIMPIIPYFGYFLIGIFLAWEKLKEPGDYLFVKLDPAKTLNRILSFMGRHALIIYLVHQPILIGILRLLTKTPKTFP